jgi:hypothetical protein
MSGVADNPGGAGGGGKDDDHTSPPPGGHQGGSGDDKHNNDRKKSSAPSTTSSSITTAKEDKEDKQVANNNKAIQYHTELEQAARNSIQGNVGAYSVVPGSLPSRRVAGVGDDDAISGIGTGTGSSTAQGQGGTSNSSMNIQETTNGGGTGGISEESSSANLPPNIDIIAEATLVPNQGDTEAQEDDDADDVDTLGLPHHVSPPLGGATGNFDGVSVISAMTNPTAIAGDTPNQPISTISFRNSQAAVQEAPVQVVNPTDDEEAQVAAGAAEKDKDAISSQEETQDTSSTTIIPKAELIEDDGPMHFLRSKSGRVMCGVAVAATILVLSLGLGFGLSNKNKRSKDDGSDTTASVPSFPDPNQVLAYAGGNFCFTSSPEIFFDQNDRPWKPEPSICTKDDIMLGGTVQQAVADAQLRPHPYCPEEASELVCSVTSSTPQISLVNGGAIRGEIAANSPVTRDMITQLLPFSDTVSYVQLRGSDVVKVLENAIERISREIPLNPWLQGAYPYASGLKFSVDLTVDNSTSMVSNVQVLDSATGEYVPIDETSSYWVVTNKWIAEKNGDNYLNDVTPLNVISTDLGYTQELENYLTTLDGPWDPPTIPDGMSTVSFNAEGIPVAFYTDVEPPKACDC